MKEKSNVIVDFSMFPFCFRNAECGDYNNKLKDEKEFFEKFKNLFEVLIPHISSNTFDVLMGERMHCHPIKPEDDDKIKLIYNIVGILALKWKPGINVEQFLMQNLDGEKIWQLGNNSTRLIGIRKENFFHVLFIDYHHLIYPSIKYNDKNFKKYKFEVVK